LLKARGRQRTDATHVLASVRAMNRLELLAESLRAALNDVAAIAPEWLRGMAPAAWYERYGRRVEDSRLPHVEADREVYARTVGEDGFFLLDQLETPEAAAELRELATVRVLRQLWHETRTNRGLNSGDGVG
jgi:transposase